MKPVRALLGWTALSALSCTAAGPTSEQASNVDQPPPGFAVAGAVPCDPVGEIQFICDLISPEDIAIIPDSEWVIASGAQEGGRIHLVHARDKTTTVLFPTAQPDERLDATTYPTCPGPLEEEEAFRAHGLYLKPGGVVHTLYVVHHGTRESVEVFEVDAQATPPALTWVGCAPALSTLSLNSVVALPEGAVCGDKWADGGRVGMAHRNRMGADTRQRRHGAEWIGNFEGRTLDVHCWVERGEADADLAGTDARAEGRYRPGIPARQLAHVARRFCDTRGRSH